MTDQAQPAAGGQAQLGTRIPTRVLTVAAVVAIALLLATLVITLLVLRQPDLVPIPVASASRV